MPSIPVHLSPVDENEVALCALDVHGLLLVLEGDVLSGGNCIEIGLPGKLILSKRKGLREVLFS